MSAKRDAFFEQAATACFKRAKDETLISNLHNQLRIMRQDSANIYRQEQPKQNSQIALR